MKFTTDLWFAVFLIISNVKLNSFENIDARRGRFFFEISDNDWRDMKVKYLRSQVKLIREKMEELKSLVA